MYIYSCVIRKISTYYFNIFEILFKFLGSLHYVVLLKLHLLAKKSYFITFIDDFIMLWLHLSIAWQISISDLLEVHIKQVERKLDKTVQTVRSDRGGEYYRNYNESWQCLGAFAKLLERYGICARYTMPNTLHQNGEAERRSRT